MKLLVIYPTRVKYIIAMEKIKSQLLELSKETDITIIKKQLDKLSKKINKEYNKHQFSSYVYTLICGVINDFTIDERDDDAIDKIIDIIESIHTLEDVKWIDTYEVNDHGYHVRSTSTGFLQSQNIWYEIISGVDKEWKGISLEDMEIYTCMQEILNDIESGKLDKMKLTLHIMFVINGYDYIDDMYK